MSTNLLQLLPVTKRPHSGEDDRAAKRPRVTETTSSNATRNQNGSSTKTVKNEAVMAGTNVFGALGIGPISRSRSLCSPAGLGDDVSLVQVSPGHRHTLALDAEGNVWACGWGNGGRLGLANTNDCNRFAKVPLNAISSRVVQVACGGSFSALLTENGRVYTFGVGGYGQLGLSHRDDKHVPTLVSALEHVHIVQISLGFASALALDNNGNIFTWGSNSEGQLGQNHTKPKASPSLAPTPEGVAFSKVIAGAFHSFAIDTNGCAWSCGGGEYGQLGTAKFSTRTAFAKVEVPVGAKIVDGSAGMYHTILIDENGRAYVCGNNNNGQLGLGDVIQREKFTAVGALEGVNVSNCSAGVMHSIFVSDSGQVFVCGSNKDGQLCNPTIRESVATPTPVALARGCALVAAAGGCGSVILVSDC